MYRSTAAERRRASAGFTIIEVLVALAVVAASLTAIGSLIAVTVRGTRALDTHLYLVETTRAVAAGLPGREQLRPGNLAGAAGDFRWRIDVLPFQTDLDPRLPTPWIPQSVVVRVQSPGGPVFQLDTVRLRARPAG